MICSMIVCLTIIMYAFSVMAYEQLSNGEFEYKIRNDDTIEIIKPVDSLTGVAKIPEYIDGYVVKSVGSDSSGTEKMWSNVSKIIIPDTVNKVGEIFGENTKEIVIGNGLDEDRSISLLKCDNLKKITLNSGCLGYLSGTAEDIELIIGKNVSSLREINARQFRSVTVMSENPYYFSTGTEVYNKEKTELLVCVNAKNLTTINILPTTKKISRLTISEFERLKKVSIPYGLIEIEDNNFKDCPLLEKCVIPDTVQTIGDWCFINNPSMKEVYIGANVTSLGEHNGYNCFTNEAYGEEWMGAIPSSAMFYVYRNSIAEDYLNIGNCTNPCISWYENEYGIRPEFKYTYIDYIPNNYTAPILVKYNNNYIGFDQQPIIQDDRTLVPLRAIFEALGASVEWDDVTQTVTSVRNDTEISLTINSAQLYVNGTAKELDVPARLINDRTMVPARAVAESFNCSVNWDDNEQTVIITE